MNLKSYMNKRKYYFQILAFLSFWIPNLILFGTVPSFSPYFVRAFSSNFDFSIYIHSSGMTAYRVTELYAVWGQKIQNFPSCKRILLIYWSEKQNQEHNVSKNTVVPWNYIYTFPFTEYFQHYYISIPPRHFELHELPKRYILESEHQSLRQLAIFNEVITYKQKVAWTMRCDDDLFFDLKKFAFFKKFLSKRPFPFSEYYDFGQCTVRIHNGVPHTILHGGTGNMYSYAFVYALNSIDCDIIRLTSLADDWEIPQWAKKMGVSPMDMHFPYAMATWEGCNPKKLVQREKLPVCNLKRARSSLCYSKTIINLEDLIMFHTYPWNGIGAASEFNFTGLGIMLPPYGRRFSPCRFEQQKGDKDKKDKK